MPSTLLKVLSLSTVFPNPADPNLGLFVRTRLQEVAAFRDEVEVRVVAPVPVLDYGNYPGRLLRLGDAPSRRVDGPLEVLHPKWLYPPFFSAGNPWWLYLRLAPLLAALRPSFPFELIDAHFAFVEGAAAALLARHFDCPFLVTLRGNEPAHARHPLRARAIQYAVTRASRVIAVSEDLRRFAVAQGASPGRTRTVPNGIDAAIYHQRDRAACRRQHGLSADEPVILSAGYLIERKGHHLAVRALRAVRDQGIPARLLIAGGPGREGQFEPRIRAVIAELGLGEHVRMLGPVSQPVLAELMSAADVYCLPSHREGWPNVVHEAMGCGAPVVATNVGGIPQMIPSEEYGFVVPAGDQEALEQALLRALSKTWDRAAVSAHAQSRAWRQVAREVLAEMKAAVAEHPAGGRA
jgi:glycosyltransferase involved in cell wall biosynthesis